MSLPEDPKERLKIFILAAVMGLTTTAVIIMFVVKPKIQRKAEILEEQALIEDELSSARKGIARMIQGRANNHLVLKELVELSDHGEHIIHPSFGRNYLLVAKAILQKHAATAKVEMDISERGFSVAPRSKRSTDRPMLKYYNIMINLQNAGLHDLQRFMDTLERGSPYLNIGEVTVKASEKKPGAHGIGILVQWPVWAEENTPENLQAQVDEMNKMSAGSTKQHAKIQTP
jgi:hypothetical protein